MSQHTSQRYGPPNERPYEPPYEPTYEPPYERAYEPPYELPYGPLDGQPFEPAYGQPYGPPPADWRCTDQPPPRSAVDFPPGFAPLMGTKAQFIAATNPGWTELAKTGVPKAPPGIAKRQDHAAPANDSGAQSEQRAGSFPPAAKIKDQEAAVTPGQTTELELPPTEKSELGSPQTSTSTLPKANAPNTASGAGAPTPRKLATQRPSSVEDRQLMKALSAWATITDVVRTHLWHIRFFRTRAGQALISLGAIFLAAAVLLLAAARQRQSGLVEGFVPRDAASISLGENSLGDPPSAGQSLAASAAKVSNSQRAIHSINAARVRGAKAGHHKCQSSRGVRHLHGRRGTMVASCHSPCG